jgi:gluconate 5-dehydrogenase
MASALAEAGADVVLASRREELCRERAREIEQSTGVRAAGLRLDVRESAGAARVFQAASDSFGRLDIAVINAGVSGIGAGATLGESEWREVIDSNLSGALWCARAAASLMIPRRRGAIITIASVYGFLATDGRLYTDPGKEPLENPGFAASKGGLIQLTRALAANWGRHQVRVNCISPGAFLVERIAQRMGDRAHRLVERWSERTPLGRMGDDEDLKGAVVYLASDASKYVTGHNLVVDGGWSIW